MSDKIYLDKTGLRVRREWRGLRDTMYDYWRWCLVWKDIIRFVLRSPLQVAKGLLRYRWMETYVTVPAFIDRQLEGARGPQLRMGREIYGMIVRHATDVIRLSFDADLSMGGSKKLSDKIVCLDELVPLDIMAGFPNLIGIPVQTMPIFLASMVNQQLPPVYLDSIESYGVPADVCPLPSCEAGVARDGDYPVFGKCFISCNMPCDGSVMTSSYQDRYFRLPTYCLGIPLRYNEESVQEYAVEEIKGCIRFIEEQTGETWDWDAFERAMARYNEVTQYHLDVWEANRTAYPQVTGAAMWLYRMYTFHLCGGIDERFNRTNEKILKIMRRAYADKTPCCREMRHRAIVWSCPANYYTNFATWLQNCWGIVVLMDMETHISTVMFDTSSHEQSLADLAMTYQRTTMRKHTKGGYRNVVDELWRLCDEYSADMVVMYDQISCKGMDGLQGIFDDQARARNINFLWVAQDLMDCRTISRRDMRQQVTNYMTAVLKENPVQPELVDFDDSEAW